ncbi:MAG: tetratricopeptide repeat protein [Candidatus Omnitrophica bacterium]|nr:tetratricopeptide repeat protein [Candidatus Omnitrophota bacterium]
MRYFFIITLVLLPVFVVGATDLTNEQSREYRELGYKLQMKGSADEAMAYYQKAIEMDPQYAEAHNDLGVIYENMGDFDNALLEYKRALEIDSNYLPVYTNLAFLYEKRGNVLNASHYWKKRYDLGQEGDYWWEVSRQHLLKLGTYPQLRRERLERQAASLSQNLVYDREQKRLKTIDEARLHLEVGVGFLKRGDHKAAIKEFETAGFLNPADPDLSMQIQDFYRKALQMVNKEEAKDNAEQALKHIDKEDYLSAGDKLKESLTSVLLISQEE